MHDELLPILLGHALQEFLWPSVEVIEGLGARAGVGAGDLDGALGNSLSPLYSALLLRRLASFPERLEDQFEKQLF